MFVTETWLNNDSQFSTPIGYKALFCNRQDRHGGGIMVIYKENIHITSGDRNNTNLHTFELLETTLNIDNKSYHIFCVYRPPPSRKNKLKPSDFLDEFETFLHERLLNLDNVLILGDFNIHIDNTSDPSTKAFLQTLETFDLQQHVNVATHEAGHILDLVVTRNSEDNIFSVTVEDCSVSDHSIDRNEI